MGKIANKEKKIRLIFSIAMIVGAGLALKFQMAVLFIFSSVILGALIARWYKRNSTNRITNFDAIQVLFAIIALLLTFFKSPFLLRLNHCYFNNTTINFDKYIDNEKLREHKFIFAIDNSDGYLKDSMYTFDGNKITRIEVLKSRLINDLKEVRKNNDKTSDFIIIKIGDSNNYNFNEDEWVELVERKVTQNINSIEKLKSENYISDFHGFYKRIAHKCKNDNYTLFIYSDFIHDLTKYSTKLNEKQTKELDNDVKDIKKWQKQLTKNKVTQNLFFIPKANVKMDERKVLPESTINYVNLFDISNNIQQELVAEKIEEKANLPFFYFDDISKIKSLLQLNFKNNGINIVDVNDMFKIFDCDGNDKKIYKFNKDNPNSLDYETAEILYENPLVPNITPLIKIIQNNKHYICTCNFVKNNNVWWGLLYPFISICISGFLSFSISGLINKVRGN